MLNLDRDSEKSFKRYCEFWTWLNKPRVLINVDSLFYTCSFFSDSTVKSNCKHVKSRAQTLTIISCSTTYSLYWSVKLLAITKFKIKILLINAEDNSLRIIRVFTNVLDMTLTKRWFIYGDLNVKVAVKVVKKYQPY